MAIGQVDRPVIMVCGGTTKVTCYPAFLLLNLLMQNALCFDILFLD
jgi:hypothetical protein